MPGTGFNSSLTWLPTLSVSTELASQQIQFRGENSSVLAVLSRSRQLARGSYGGRMTFERVVFWSRTVSECGPRADPDHSSDQGISRPASSQPVLAVHGCCVSLVYGSNTILSSRDVQILPALCTGKPYCASRRLPSSSRMALPTWASCRRSCSRSQVDVGAHLLDRTTARYGQLSRVAPLRSPLMRHAARSARDRRRSETGATSLRTISSQLWVRTAAPPWLGRSRSCQASGWAGTP